MDAVLLGLLAGALFGAMTVAVRAGLLRGGDPARGGVVITSLAFLVATLLAVPSIASDGVDAGELWPFAVVGFVVPGLSQIAFIFAVRWAGPSRAAILIGTAPLGSVLLAMALLDEPLRPVLLAGTALVVAGGAVLALDPGRPAGFRMLGVVLALTCAALFAGRDNAVRWIARDDTAPPLQATAVTLLRGGRDDALRDARRRQGRPAGAARCGRSLRRGCCSRSPTGARDGLRPRRRRDRRALNATQSLWAVAFAAVLYRRTEAIGRKTVLAGVLVVLGGALIGAFR